MTERYRILQTRKGENFIYALQFFTKMVGWITLVSRESLDDLQVAAKVFYRIDTIPLEVV